jgi:hypothetical protein
VWLVDVPAPVVECWLVGGTRVRDGHLKVTSQYWYWYWYQYRRTEEFRDRSDGYRTPGQAGIRLAAVVRTQPWLGTKKTVCA